MAFRVGQDKFLKPNPPQRSQGSPSFILKFSARAIAKLSFQDYENFRTAKTSP